LVNPILSEGTLSTILGKQNQNRMKSAKLKWMMIVIVMIFIHSFSKAELISTRVIGEGQPILLIHGMACSDEVWEETEKKYKSSYQLHIVSIKGFGNDENEHSENYLEQIKNELLAYCKAQKLENTIVIGHSMGGFLGLWMAAEEPKLFGKIVSVDGVPYFPVLQMPGITPETAKPMVEAMENSMTSMSEPERLANQEMIVASMIATESKREKVIKMGLKSNPRIIGKAYSEMYTNDIRPLMSKIEVPVLVFGSWAAYQIFGVTKESVTFGYEQQLKDIKIGKLLVAEKAYHFVFYDEPEWFFTEVDKFISSN
jgi:pimeloyl-ACP methyl ester carboxylesterase